MSVCVCVCVRVSVRVVVVVGGCPIFLDRARAVSSLRVPLKLLGLPLTRQRSLKTTGYKIVISTPN